LGTLLPAPATPLQTFTFASPPASTTTPIQTQTLSLLTTIRAHLLSHSLPPTSILSTSILLRRMSDFAPVNALYASLFPFPNPPARVTISCGGEAEADITIALAVHTGLDKRGGAQREALHVQSRSYWAPANIGPYSQAVSIPLASLGGGTAGGRLVSVAGQIPLVPASMEMFDWGKGRLEGQVVLGLQHLWRIGVERGVAWWTSAVAYFAGDDGEGGMEQRVELAARAWRASHETSQEEEEDEDYEGPDVWDRRYNDRYRTYSTIPPDNNHQQDLPDRSVLTPSSSSPSVPAPPLFVAEVAELPRAAGVEWHAHLGIARVGEGSVTLREVEKDAGVVVAQVIVAGASEGATSFVQTVVVERLRADVSGGAGQGEGHGKIAAAALTELGDAAAAGEPAVAVRYVDVGVLRERQGQEQDGGVGRGLVVPCRSLWDDQGRKLAAVTVYQSVFEKRG
ncbi:hypothetical protein C8A05DRAFT_18462, partial [Staphylotrichum tortipilum]